MRVTRNAIEHFAWNTTKPEADAILGRALEFAFHFARTELQVDYLDYGAHKDGTLHDLIVSNPEFGSALQRRRQSDGIQRQLEAKVCSVCRAKAVDPVTRACRLCGHWEPDRNELEDDIPF